MSQGPRVDPAVLRSSAHDSDGIADAMREPAAKATQESATAGSSLAGWSMSQALQTISTSWKPALDGLRGRAQAGAANLRSSADGHDWNEQRTAQDFEKTEASMSARAVPGELPPALRQSAPPAAGHAPGAPTKSAEEMTDPRNSYGTNMPTYDGNAGTRQSLGDFG